MKEPAEVLEEAAEKIRRDGWCQGRTRGASGEVCLLGGLHEVTLGWDGYGTIDAMFDKREAIEALLNHLQVEIFQGPSSIAAWNDTPGRTADEVVDELLLCAKDLRNQT